MKTIGMIGGMSWESTTITTAPLFDTTRIHATKAALYSISE